MDKLYNKKVISQIYRINLLIKKYSQCMFQCHIMSVNFEILWLTSNRIRQNTDGNPARWNLHTPLLIEDVVIKLFKLFSQ